MKNNSVLEFKKSIITFGKKLSHGLAPDDTLFSTPTPLKFHYKYLHQRLYHIVVFQMKFLC